MHCTYYSFLLLNLLVPTVLRAASICRAAEAACLRYRCQCQTPRFCGRKRLHGPQPKVCTVGPQQTSMVWSQTPTIAIAYHTHTSDICSYFGFTSSISCVMFVGAKGSNSGPIFRTVEPWKIEEDLHLLMDLVKRPLFDMPLVLAYLCYPASAASEKTASAQVRSSQFLSYVWHVLRQVPQSEPPNFLTSFLAGPEPTHVGAPQLKTMLYH